jgi:hypothetical protein
MVHTIFARIYLRRWGLAGLVLLDVKQLDDGELTNLHRNLQAEQAPLIPGRECQDSLSHRQNP